MDTLEKLRIAYAELLVAQKCVELAEKQARDSLTLGHCGFAKEHLEKALKLLEEVGREMKQKTSDSHSEIEGRKRG